MSDRTEEMWDGFARAIVALELPRGSEVLHPLDHGHAGTFPFDGVVHIITAYNPDGLEVGEAENLAADNELRDALVGYETFRTVGSAPDGSFAEPGFGILGIDLDEAVALGARFGQVAIYRWSADELTICDVRSDAVHPMGWRLT